MGNATRKIKESLPKFEGSPLKIGLDVSALNPNFKAHATRGIGRYVRELAKYFAESQSDKISVGNFDHEDVLEDSFFRPLIDLSPFGKTTLRQQILYPARLSNRKVCDFDLLHFPAHMDPPAWGLSNYIVTVLDLVPLVLEDLYKAINPNWRFQLARYLEIKAIKNASLILAISENTANDVERLLGISREKIIVTHLGIDKKFFISKFLSEEIIGNLLKYQLPSDRKIVLYVGGIDPRKNISGLLESFKILKTLSKEAPALIIAGNISEDKQFPDLLKLIKKLELEEDVFLPGFVPDQDLLMLFAATSVFYFPSLYEGFGFTPLEAMAAGIPVVSSNTSCMPEVLGDAAILIDPRDNERAGREMLEIISNNQLSQKLIASGRKRAAYFTWEKTGESTLKAYERFLK
ncbi:MAG: glycosyltransferase family 1 protein [bacterium]|nr:glycosyltransferase family 1 protein [bacterium]